MIIINNKRFNCTIEDIVKKLQVELSKRGSNLLKHTSRSAGYFLVSCPYHKNGLEKHPSAQFREEDGLFYCHACKEVHSLVEVIEYCLNENGWNWLRKNFLNSSVEERVVKIDTSRKNKPNDKEYVDYSELDKYRFIHKYLLDRGIDKDIIIKFDIGYDNINKCITFPNKDINGNILFIATRSIKGKQFKYPYNVKKPVYGLYEIEREINNGKKINEIYVVESMIDALQIWSWGKYAVALNGTGSMSQYEELSSFSCREYILATDNDKAGKEARVKLKNNIKNKIVKELDYNGYNDCKDINDMTKDQFYNCKILW